MTPSSNRAPFTRPHLPPKKWAMSTSLATSAPVLKIISPPLNQASNWQKTRKNKRSLKITLASLSLKSEQSTTQPSPSWHPPKVKNYRSKEDHAQSPSQNHFGKPPSSASSSSSLSSRSLPRSSSLPSTRPKNQPSSSSESSSSPSLSGLSASSSAAPQAAPSATAPPTLTAARISTRKRPSSPF